MVLMDDTVLFATSRTMMIRKFEVLMDFCERYGMVVNQLKTNFMVINGTKEDRKEFVCKTVIVKHSWSYIYLGTPFTEDCKVKSVLELHLKTRAAD